MSLKFVQCEAVIASDKVFVKQCTHMTPHIYLIEGYEVPLCGIHKSHPKIGDQRFHSPTHAYILGHGPVLTKDGEPVIETSKYEESAE